MLVYYKLQFHGQYPVSIAMAYFSLLFVLLAVGYVLPSSHGQITDLIVPDFKVTEID